MLMSDKKLNYLSFLFESQRNFVFVLLILVNAYGCSVCSLHNLMFNILNIFFYFCQLETC